MLSLLVRSPRDCRWPLLLAGGTDAEKEGGWRWTDGSVWNANWHAWDDQADQPVNIKGNEDCMSVGALGDTAVYGTETEMWYASDCSLSAPFVCKQSERQGGAATAAAMLRCCGAAMLLPLLLRCCQVLQTAY
jgi:hypothetical protein